MTDEEYKTIKYHEAIKEYEKLLDQVQEMGECVDNRDDVPIVVKGLVWLKVLKILVTAEKLYSRMADIYYATEEEES